MKGLGYEGYEDDTDFHFKINNVNIDDAFRTKFYLSGKSAIVLTM